MVNHFDNSRRTTALGILRLMLASLALLAGLAASSAQAQKATVQFLPMPGKSAVQADSAAQSKTARPMGTTYPDGTIYGNPGYYMGTAAVRSSTATQVTLSFYIYTEVANYTPTLKLQYGISYSVAPITCTQSANPNFSAGSSVPVDQFPYIENCSVKITFAPLYPGGHKDALYVVGPDGQTVIGGQFLYGIGMAPQLMIQPGVTTSLSSPDGTYLYGATADEAGTFYTYTGAGNIYSVKKGVPSLVANNVPRAYSLSVDGAGTFFMNGNGGGYAGYSLSTSNGSTWPIALKYQTASSYASNPQILPFTTNWDVPVTLAAGNLGYYYEADGGGEYRRDNSQYGVGLNVQPYGTNGQPYTLAAPVIDSANDTPNWGNIPYSYPLSNYGPSVMVVDPYENLFFGDSSGATSVWCGWGTQTVTTQDYIINLGLSTAAVTGNTNGCGGWGTSMVSLNQTQPAGSISVDAADTLYLSQNGVNLFPASNNYATAVTSIGIAGYAASNALAPDGTLYVDTAYSNIDVIDRSQGLIDFGANNGSTPSPYTATLYNGGNQPLTISSMTISGAGYTMAPTTSNGCSNGAVLAVGAICQFQVTSTPPHNGLFTGAVTIVSNSLNNPAATQTIALTGYTSGIYVAPTPNPLAFGFVTPGQTSTLPDTIVNNSVGSNSYGYGSSVYIPGSITSNNPAFTATAGTCSAIETNTAPFCSINVTFNPSSATSYNGTISWTEAISGSPGITQQVSLPVNGTGINPIIPLSDSEGLHITDTVKIVPSTLLSINELLTTSDNAPAVTPSTLLPVAEAMHVADAINLATTAPYVTTTTLSASATTVQTGGSVTLTGTTTTFGTTTVPTGTLNFYEDGNLLGSGTLSGGVATYTTPALATGSHTFAAKFVANATFNASTSANIAVTVTTATVLNVAAQSITRAFGVSNPAFTYNVTGFINGDTISVLSGAPAFTTTATLNSVASTYPLNISAGTLGAPSRYAFNFVPGTVTVTSAAPQFITFTPISSVSLSAATHLTLTAYSSSGLPIAYAVTGPATVSVNTVQLTGTGVVTITATQNGNATFAAATSMPQSFTVVP